MGTATTPGRGVYAASAAIKPAACEVANPVSVYCAKGLKTALRLVRGVYAASPAVRDWANKQLLRDSAFGREAA